MDMDKSFRMFFVVWIFSALVGLSLLAGLIYVAIHFISKFW